MYQERKRARREYSMMVALKNILCLERQSDTAQKMTQKKVKERCQSGEILKLSRCSWDAENITFNLLVIFCKKVTRKLVLNLKWISDREGHLNKNLNIFICIC